MSPPAGLDLGSDCNPVVDFLLFLCYFEMLDWTGGQTVDRRDRHTMDIQSCLARRAS